MQPEAGRAGLISFDLSVYLITLPTGSTTSPINKKVREAVKMYFKQADAGTDVNHDSIVAVKF